MDSLIYPVVINQNDAKPRKAQNLGDIKIIVKFLFLHHHSTKDFIQFFAWINVNRWS